MASRLETIPQEVLDTITDNLPRADRSALLRCSSKLYDRTYHDFLTDESTLSENLFLAAYHSNLELFQRVLHWGTKRWRSNRAVLRKAIIRLAVFDNDFVRENRDPFCENERNAAILPGRSTKRFTGYFSILNMIASSKWDQVHDHEIFRTLVQWLSPEEKKSLVDLTNTWSLVCDIAACPLLLAAYVETGLYSAVQREGPGLLHDRYATIHVTRIHVTRDRDSLAPATIEICLETGQFRVIRISGADTLHAILEDTFNGNHFNVM